MKGSLILAVAFAGSGACAFTGPFVYGIHRNTGLLYRVSVLTAQVDDVGPTGIVGAAGLEFTPNASRLYALDTTSKQLYRVDPNTGSATAVLSLGSSLAFEGGLAFASNTLAYFTNGGNAGAATLLRLDLALGSVSTVGNMGPADINGLAMREDGMLIGLDRVSNGLVTIDPTNAAMSSLASIPDTIGGVGGMAVYFGMGYFSTSGPQGPFAGSNSLYSFDLFTGQSTLVAAFPSEISDLGLSGLAAVPEPASLVALGAGLALIVRRRGRG